MYGACTGALKGTHQHRRTSLAYLTADPPPQHPKLVVLNPGPRAFKPCTLSACSVYPTTLSLKALKPHKAIPSRPPHVAKPASLLSTPWTLNPTPWTLNPTPWTLNPTPWTLNPTPWTLNPTPYILTS